MTIVWQSLKRVVAPVGLWLAVLIGVGLLAFSGSPSGSVFGEDAVNRDLARDRTPAWDAVTWFFSMVGSTPVIIGVAVLAAIVLRLRLRRWREPIFLCLAVAAQAVVFFFTTLAIDRTRPHVPKMDESPPTSSFPSGHTSASVALYAGLALVLALLVRRSWLKAVCWLLILVPVGVAVSRMYRGMHHPSDVIASFVNGAVCITISARALLDRTVRWARPKIALPLRRARAA